MDVVETTAPTMPAAPSSPDHIWDAGAALPPPPPESQGPSSVARPPRRGWGVASIALALALVLLLGGGALYLTRGGTSQPPTRVGLDTGATSNLPYQLVFSRTAATRYKATAALHLAVDSADLGLHKSAEGAADMVLGLRQLSEDDRGVTTVQVAFEHGSRIIDGAHKPFLHGTLTVRLTPDGRILSDSASGGIAGSLFNFDLPSMEQFTPVLPNRKVAPGDSWTRKISVPFFLGYFRFTIHSTLDHYTQIKGARAAVIHTTGTGSLRMDLRDSDAELLIGQPAPLSPGGHEKLTLNGGSTFDVTDVVDLLSGHWYKSAEQSAAHFVMSISEDTATGGHQHASISIDGSCSATMSQIS